MAKKLKENSLKDESIEQPSNANEELEVKEDKEVEEDSASFSSQTKGKESNVSAKQSKAQIKQAKKAEQEKLKAKKLREKQRLREENNDGEPTLRDVFKAITKSNKKKKNEPIVVKRVKRVKTDYQTGLTSEQVQERIEKGQINASPNTNVKTIKSIVFENVFTFFNMLCFVVFIALVVVNVLYKQAWSNVMFMAIILINIIIGIVQEVSCKKDDRKVVTANSSCCKSCS